MILVKFELPSIHVSLLFDKGSPDKKTTFFIKSRNKGYLGVRPSVVRVMNIKLYSGV